MQQQDLFDREESERRKQEGMDLASTKQETNLYLARQIAIEIAQKNGCVTADDVGAELAERYGIATLGPAAGSLFRNEAFVCTGERVRSTRKTNHARELHVWKLKEND